MIHFLYFVFQPQSSISKCSILQVKLSDEPLIRLTDLQFIWIVLQQLSFFIHVSCGLLYYVQLFTLALLGCFLIAFEMIGYGYNHAFELLIHPAMYHGLVIFGRNMLSCFLIISLFMHRDVYVCSWFFR